ncbi:MAG: acetyl-CoA carboxylase biotin carboxyl carrier protein subunit [Bacteroidales bacterium]|nr:acetyl-CoA carboxylase biotin carboxyl carrier protein subunit [Bacteroidales bacterium]
MVKDKTKNKSNSDDNSKEELCGKKIKCKTLIIHGTKYKTTLTKKYENRKKWEKPDEKKIVSYIPGTIIELFVKEGQTVKKGDKLLILEAMKMQNIIYNSCDGVLKSVNIKVGERIPKNFLMIEYK